MASSPPQRWLLPALALSCAPYISREDLNNLPSTYRFDNAHFVHPDVLPLRSAWSPANPIPSIDDVIGPDQPDFSPEFNFCFDVPQGAFDLNQATWMSFFAAGAYGHLGYLGPQLQALGFRSPTGVDRDWEQCALDLETMHADQNDNEDLFRAAIRFGILKEYLQERFFDNDRWGPCAAEWFQNDALFDGDTLPHGPFTQWLLQRPRPEDYVTFACGGSWSFEQTDFDEGSTQAVVMRRPRDPLTGAPPVVIVAFRGSELEWNDWAVNAAVAKVDLSTPFWEERGWGPGWGEVHGGFLNAYASIDPQADALGQLFLAESDPPQIYVTGHSLGGALATILSARILQQMERQSAAGGPVFDFRGLYTFGAPRVGDAQFAAHFDALAAAHGVTIGRVRNTDDLVTTVPTPSFTHVGPMFYIEEDIGGSSELDVTLQQLAHTIDSAGLALSIGDHNPSGYDESLNTDRRSETFEQATYKLVDSGYYRRLREALELSREPGSALQQWTHCAAH